MTLFGVAALIAPVVGPTLGGWLTVNYNWRWIFYINVPVGLLALGACAISLPGSGLPRGRAGGAAQAAAQLRLHRPVAAGPRHVCWEIMLSKGQEWDWLGDPFWRVQTLVILFVLGLAVLIFREMRIRVRSSTSGRCASGTSPPAASSSSAPSPCCTPPAPRCRPCSSRCSATTHCAPDWSCRPRASSPSSPCRSWAACSVGEPTPAG